MYFTVFMDIYDRWRQDPLCQEIFRPLNLKHKIKKNHTIQRPKIPQHRGTEIFRTEEIRPLHDGPWYGGVSTFLTNFFLTTCIHYRKHPPQYLRWWRGIHNSKKSAYVQTITGPFECFREMDFRRWAYALWNDGPPRKRR